MRRVCLDMVYELAISDKRVCFVGSDLGPGVLEEFGRKLPNQFFMEGVSEANIVGMSAGLALEGKIPYLNTIATFFTRRALDQIAIDLCLHNANVRLIGSGGGLVYAAQGPTHMAVEDLALMCAMPNMTVVAPADAAEMAAFMPQTLEWKGPIYIRLARGGDDIVTDKAAPFKIGKARKLRDSGEAVFITTGSCAQIALEASDLLEEEGVTAGVLHVPTLKPFDLNAITTEAEKVRAVVVIEEHVPSGGLASSVAQALMEANFDSPKRYSRIGLPDAFPDDYGTQQDLQKRYGIDAETAAKAVKDLLSRG